MTLRGCHSDRQMVSQGHSSEPGWQQQIAWKLTYTHAPHNISTVCTAWMWNRESMSAQWHCGGWRRRGLTLSDWHQAWRGWFTSAAREMTTTQRRVSAKALHAAPRDLGEGRGQFQLTPHHSPSIFRPRLLSHNWNVWSVSGFEFEQLTQRHLILNSLKILLEHWLTAQ